MILKIKNIEFWNIYDFDILEINIYIYFLFKLLNFYLNIF
jgi:hypothetical protein